jgi:PUA-domain protein
MSKIKRRTMKEKEAKKLLSEFFQKAKISPRQLPMFEPPIELAKINGEEIFFIDKKPILAKSNGELFPTLMSDEFLQPFPKAIVNMGAVPHVCNGADIMAPGIVSFEGDFTKESLVVVYDERHQKPIALALALYNLEETKKLKRGKVLKNIHYVGDRLWKTMKQLSGTT